MTRKARTHEFRMLPRVGSGQADMDLLADLDAQGWEIVGFDWADHGTHGAMLLRRPVTKT